jgi:hypothetical protein
MKCACAILSSVACPALQYFPTLSHKRHDFKKTPLLNIKSVFRVSLLLLSETLFIRRITERDMTNCIFGLHVK